jgi:hypothetical protein
MRALCVPFGLVLALMVGCGDDDPTSSGPGAGGSGSTQTGAGPSGPAGPGSGGASGASTAGAGGSTGADIPGGGTVLFEEDFDDAAFSTRGWYDSSGGAISGAEHAPNSSSSFECAFAQGATSCSGGTPARHPVTPTETVYQSFWIKFSANWVGSGVAYHPHMMHFITDADPDYVGPAHTFLTTYQEVVGGEARIAIQDSKNVDLSCILRNDDTFVGCNGDFSTYPFTEARSVASCNGLAGYVEMRDCFSNGNGTWYSARAWGSPGAFTDGAGPNDKTAWHFVEVYYEMNTIEGGVGVPNGKIRWVQDGQVLISSDQILLRTAQHATLRFDQFAMLPYIGPGSPVAQSLFIDDIVVATARP